MRTASFGRICSRISWTSFCQLSSVYPACFRNSDLSPTGRFTNRYLVSFSGAISASLGSRIRFPGYMKEGGLPSWTSWGSGVPNQRRGHQDGEKEAVSAASLHPLSNPNCVLPGVIQDERELAK